MVMVIERLVIVSLYAHPMAMIYVVYIIIIYYAHDASQKYNTYIVRIKNIRNVFVHLFLTRQRRPLVSKRNIVFSGRLLTIRFSRSQVKRRRSATSAARCTWHRSRTRAAARVSSARRRRRSLRRRRAGRRTRMTRLTVAIRWSTRRTAAARQWDPTKARERWRRWQLAE